MKRVLAMIAMAGILVGGTLVNSLAASNQEARQGDDHFYAEAAEQGMVEQHMMAPRDRGQYMMWPQHMPRYRLGPYAMGGIMSGMMDRMDDGPMGLFMMEQQPERDFYLDRVKELNLSADQVARLKTLRLECRKDNLRSASEATIARLELSNLLGGDQWSLKDAEALVRKIQEKETDIQVRHLKAAIDARKVLTPRQLAQVKAGDDLDDSDGQFG